jgi:2-octaprenyl-6-methoxyphenol hydroxylase
LVGDAAHGMHPIAGQGLNLGWRGAAALTEIIYDAKKLGLDYGLETVLENYERWRRFDNTLMLGMTDGLNRLFSNNIGPLKFMRDAGLAIVNQLPPLKKIFMGSAMGLSGDVPKLMRGENL